jgi:hypothetical protein
MFNIIVRSFFFLSLCIFPNPLEMTAYLNLTLFFSFSFLSIRDTKPKVKL